MEAASTPSRPNVGCSCLLSEAIRPAHARVGSPTTTSAEGLTGASTGRGAEAASTPIPAALLRDAGRRPSGRCFSEAPGDRRPVGPGPAPGLPSVAAVPNNGVVPASRGGARRRTPMTDEAAGREAFERFRSAYEVGDRRLRWPIGPLSLRPAGRSRFGDRPSPALRNRRRTAAGSGPGSDAPAVEAVMDLAEEAAPIRRDRMARRTGGPARPDACVRRRAPAVRGTRPSRGCGVGAPIAKTSCRPSTGCVVRYGGPEPARPTPARHRKRTFSTGTRSWPSPLEEGSESSAQAYPPLDDSGRCAIPSFPWPGSSGRAKAPARDGQPLWSGGRAASPSNYFGTGGATPSLPL